MIFLFLGMISLFSKLSFANLELEFAMTFDSQTMRKSLPESMGVIFLSILQPLTLSLVRSTGTYFEKLEHLTISFTLHSAPLLEMSTTQPLIKLTGTQG